MTKSSPNIWTLLAGRMWHRSRGRATAVALAALVFAVFAAPGIAPAAAQDLAVTEVRLGVHPDSTRFVLELSGGVEPRIFGLPDPYRVVIDLPQVRFDLAADAADAAAGVVTKMRYGQFRPGTSRLVIDLAEPAKVKRHFILEPQSSDQAWRLVIDLETTDRADFITAMRPAPTSVVTPAAPPPLLNDQDRDPDAPQVVVIDPGHGGIDPGAVGGDGSLEKDLVLDYALEIRRQLNAIGDYEVVLTREADVFLPLRARVDAARRARADLFLSLHANTNDNNRVSGFSAYTLSERASDREAAALAATENKADIIAGVDLEQFDDDVASILIDFARTKTNELSVSFAREDLLREVGDQTRLLTRPLRSAGFAVLKAPDVPSVLLELGHITNPDELARMRSADHRTALSAAIAGAVDRHFTKVRAARRS